MTNEEYTKAVDLKRVIASIGAETPIEQMTVLNLGAGTCGSFVSKHILELPFHFLANVEVFAPYYNVLEQLKFRSIVVMNYNETIQDHLLKLNYMNKYFDLILMIDVLEHMTKDDAYAVLDEVIKISEHVILFVPVGLCPQEPYDGNIYQQHLSTWELDELERIGHSVEYHPTLHGSFGAAWVKI